MRGRAAIVLTGVAALVVGLTFLGVQGHGLGVVGEEKLNQRLEPGRVTLSDVVEQLNFGDDVGRYSLYAALSEEAPEAFVVLLDDDIPFDASAFSVFGKGAGVREISETSADQTLRAAAKAYRRTIQLQGLATRSGVYRAGGNWYDFELHVLDLPVTALTVELDLPPGRSKGDSEMLYVLDVRLLGPEADESLGESGMSETSNLLRRPAPSNPWALEAALTLALLLLGGLFIPRRILAGPVRPAASLIAGLAVQGVVGAFGRGWSVVFLPLTFGLLIAVAFRLKGVATGWTRRDVPALTISAIAVGSAVALTRQMGLVHVSTDTAGYLGRAAVQARDLTGFTVPTGQSSGYVSLHAAGHLVGADAMFAVGLLVFFAALGLVANVALRAAPRVPAGLALFVVFGVLVGTDFIRRIAMLLNSHVIVAAFLLLLSVLWLSDLPAAGRFDPVPTLAALVGVAVIFARPEGIAYVAVFLAGTLGMTGWERWRPVWWAGGIGVLIQVLPGVVSGPGGLGRTELGLIVAGSILAIAPSVLLGLPRGLLNTVPLLAVSLPWTALLLLRDDNLRALLTNTQSNLFVGTGGWGLSAVSLLLLLGVAAVLWSVALRRGNGGALLPLWTLLLAYPPVVLLIRGLGEQTGGRAHWHDSVNRMWVHLLLLVALLVVMSIRAFHQQSPDAAATSRANAWSLLAAGAAIGAISLPALAWDPTFVRETPRSETIAREQPEWDGLRAGDGWRLTGRVGPELVGLQSVVTTVPLDLSSVDAGSLRQPGELCVGMRMGDFDRALTGQVEFAVASGGFEATGQASLTERDDLLEGVFRASVCFPVAEEDGGLGALGTDALITVRGRGTGEDSAPAVILDSEGTPVVSAELRWADPPQAWEPAVRHGPRVSAVFAGLLLLGLLPPPAHRRVHGIPRAGIT